jgi:FixJ family two-component response regulator
MRPTSPVTVFIIDDDEGSRESLKWLVESGGFTARTFASASDYLEYEGGEPPECIVLDVRMPGVSGVQLLEQLNDAATDIPIIMISGFADVRTAVRAMRGGAIDFLEKPVNGEELLERVTRCLELARQRRRSVTASRKTAERLQDLTRRERQIMDLIVAGKSNKETAAQLGISPRTVEVHRRNLMKKTGATSFAALVRLAAARDK